MSLGWRWPARRRASPHSGQTWPRARPIREVVIFVMLLSYGDSTTTSPTVISEKTLNCIKLNVARGVEINVVCSNLYFVAIS